MALKTAAVRFVNATAVAEIVNEKTVAKMVAALKAVAAAKTIAIVNTVVVTEVVKNAAAVLGTVAVETAMYVGTTASVGTGTISVANIMDKTAKRATVQTTQEL